MKKIFLLAGLLLCSFVSLLGQDADAVTGVWLNAEKDGSVEIYKSGDKYFGKIVWSKYQYEADGKTPLKDGNNEDVTLRSRPLMGLVVLTDFVYEKGAWVKGSVYDPRSGKTFSSRMKIKGDNLDIRGYIGKPMLGKSTIWTRKP